MKLTLTLKTVLLAGAILACASSANAACTVPASSFFKNPHCVVVPDSYDGSAVDMRMIAPQAAYAGDGKGSQEGEGYNEAPRSFQRAYALGTQPKGKTTVNGVKEVSRFVQRRTDGFWKSKTTLPGVTIDPVKKTRTISTVVVTYSTVPEKGGNNHNSGDAQMGGSGRSHQ